MGMCMGRQFERTIPPTAPTLGFQRLLLSALRCFHIERNRSEERLGVISQRGLIQGSTGRQQLLSEELPLAKELLHILSDES